MTQALYANMTNNKKDKVKVPYICVFELKIPD
jgi:hypothetical protein